MFTVGWDSSRSFACSHGRSSIQCETESDFFDRSSLRSLDASAIIARSSSESGRGVG